MILRRLQFGVVALLVIGSVAIPVVLWRSGQAGLQEPREVSAKQAEEVAQLTEENERLSNVVAQSSAAQTLSADEIKELLRLRSEIARLHDQMRQADRLREENQLLKAPSPTMASLRSARSPAELETELSGQTLNAMRDVCRELPQALQKFANDRGTQPHSLPELRNYFPTVEGHKLPGLYTFTFVRDEGPKPGDQLILREEGSRGRLDGKVARVYGFRDGNAIEATSENGDFEAWERQYLGAPSSVGP